VYAVNIINYYIYINVNFILLLIVLCKYCIINTYVHFMIEDEEANKLLGVISRWDSYEWYAYTNMSCEL